jgi:hypothetical protein
VTSVVTVFDADTVLARCQGILQAVVDAADALPGVVTLPARQLVTSAGATWDCEMVFVSALSVQTGLPESLQDAQYGGVNTYPQGNQTAWTVTVEVGVVRKVAATPIGQGRTSPEVGKFTADLTNVSSDTAVLINAANTLVARDMQPVPQAASMLASQGGFHGVAVTVTVELWPGP